MTKLALVLVPMLLCGVSQAAPSAQSLVCTGESYGYSFTITAKVSGDALYAKVSALVAKDRKVVKQGNLSISSGEYNPRYLNFIAKDKDTQITVMATRSNGGGYTGTIDVVAPEGSLQVATTCSVR